MLPVVAKIISKIILERQKQLSNKALSRGGVFVEIDGYNFEVVKDFVYRGSSINTDNDISL